MTTIGFTVKQGLPKELYRVKYDRNGNQYYETLTAMDTLPLAAMCKSARYKAPDGKVYSFPLTPCLFPSNTN